MEEIKIKNFVNICRKYKLSIEQFIDEFIKMFKRKPTLNELRFYVGLPLITKPVYRVMFNDNVTILEIGDFKTVVKCHEGDTFEYHIGLGLALSRYYGKQKSTKKEVKYLKDELSYLAFAEYCFRKYFNFDPKRLAAFLEKCEKGKWIDL